MEGVSEEEEEGVLGECLGGRQRRCVCVCGGTMRPLCFIFLESSLKTADTWYKGGVVAGGHTAINTRTHTERKGVCEADTHPYKKAAEEKG